MTYNVSSGTLSLYTTTTCMNPGRSNIYSIVLEIDVYFTVLKSVAVDMCRMLKIIFFKPQI